MIKACEPVITVLLGGILTGARPSAATCVGVGLITGGVLVCTVGDTALTRAAVRWTVLSSLCLPIRNLFGKQLDATVGSSLNTFVVATWGAFGLYIPWYIVVRWCAAASSDASVPALDHDFRALMPAAVSYTAYNCASFLFLGLYSPVTHSVANGMKRITSIMVATMYFRDVGSTVMVPGLLMLFLGLAVYAHQKTQTSKVHQPSVVPPTGNTHSPKPARVVSVGLVGTVVIATTMLWGDCTTSKNVSGTTNLIHSSHGSLIPQSVWDGTAPVRLSADCLTYTGDHQRNTVSGVLALPSPAGTKCDDGDPKTFMDACDGAGSCSGTVDHSDLSPLKTEWFQGNNPLTLINRAFHPRNSLKTMAELEKRYPQAVGKIPNFGDELGPLLLRWLSGRRVVLDRKLPDYLIVGSVADFVTRNRPYGNNNVTLWGPGTKFFGKGAWNNSKGSARCLDYRSFRGPFTRSMCLESGCRCPAVYGDPALLLPLFYRPARTKLANRIDLCIIPHINEYNSPNAVEGWLHKAGVPSVVSTESTPPASEPPRRYFPPYGIHDGMVDNHINVRFIDIRADQSQYSVFVDALVGCPWIASTSLHGVILAEAYRVPWRLIFFEGPKLATRPETMCKYEVGRYSRSHHAVRPTLFVVNEPNRSATHVTRLRISSSLLAFHCHHLGHVGSR